VQACPQETNHHPSPFGEQSFTNWSRNLAARQISRSGPLYSSPPALNLESHPFYFTLPRSAPNAPGPGSH
jgi:hypothetical protein